MTKKLMTIYLYTRYERFWHWLQTILIVLLIITGFEISGLYTLFGYEAAVNIHETLVPVCSRSRNGSTL